MAKVCPWLFAVCVVPGLLLLALTWPTFSVPFYEKEYGKLNVYESIGVSKDETMRVTRHMLDYMRGRNDDLQIQVTLGAGPDSIVLDFFSERAIAHMVDVKQLVLLAVYTRNVLLVLAAAFLGGCFKGGLRFKRVSKALLLVSGGLCVLGGALAAAIAANFDRAFTAFHHLFFTNDLWLLDWDDRLLGIVPTGFFMDIAARIGVLALCFVIGVNVIFGALRILDKRMPDKTV